MKLIFAAEDTIIGIVAGILLIGLSGRFFELKLGNALYIIVFIIYTLFILLDIYNEISDLTTHFGFIVFSLLHNLADLGISLTFISHFSGWNIPYITSNIIPFLQNEFVIFIVGLYLVIGNIVWLFLYPFLD